MHLHEWLYILIFHSLLVPGSYFLNLGRQLVGSDTLLFGYQGKYGLSAFSVKFREMSMTVHRTMEGFYVIFGHAWLIHDLLGFLPALLQVPVRQSFRACTVFHPRLKGHHGFASDVTRLSIQCFAGFLPVSFLSLVAHALLHLWVPGCPCVGSPCPRILSCTGINQG